MNSTGRCLFVTLTALTVFFISGIAKAQVSLDSVLHPYLARYGLPAIAAAVVIDGTVVSAGAVGTRRAGAKIPVTINDRFHLGSDTKAMTALLAAMLVEEGKLRWNTTPAEIFPELAEKMDPGLRSAKLEQLLSHTKRDFAMVIVTNIGGQKANTAFLALATELYTKFAKPHSKVE